MSSKIQVEIWSDVVCPWCWVGKHRFEKALALSPDKERFEIVHRAFRLEPGAKVTPALQMMQKKFGMTEAQALARWKEFEDNAKSDNLKFNLGGTLFGDSLDAHRLIQWAAPSGLQMKLVEALYEAYFSKNISIFDETQLLAVVKSVGLNPDEARTMLAGDGFKQAVTLDEEKARQYGANGVPFFVFASKYGVSGAQAPETFTQVIERVLADHPAPLVNLGQNTEVCGPDGCALPEK